MHSRQQAATPESRFKNKILQHLPPEVIARMQLRTVQLPVEREIEYPGDRIDHMVFLESGVASMTTTFQDGKQAEVGLFGFEAAIGVSALMGTKRSLNRVYMQIAGHGYQSPMEAVITEFKTGGQFHKLVLNYVQAQLIQVAQSAGCNISHNLEQRLSRWLLLCADRSRTDSFVLSQEFLSMMLGVRRSSVNIAIGHLEEAGLVAIHRQRIQIVDFQGLERRSCECYRVVKQHLDSFADYDSGQADSEM